MEEIWKTIEGFENYQVSNHGRVKRVKSCVLYKNGILCNHKEKLLTQELNRKMYKRVTLSKNNIQIRHQVHRLVATYFIANNENKPCVNHIDGNGSNNNVLNLEWCTYSENERHSYDILCKKSANRKLTETEAKNVFLIGVKGIKGNVNILMAEYNVSRKCILNIINKKHYVKVTELPNRYC